MGVAAPSCRMDGGRFKWARMPRIYVGDAGICQIPLSFLLLVRALKFGAGRLLPTLCAYQAARAGGDFLYALRLVPADEYDRTGFRSHLDLPRRATPAGRVLL